MLKIVQTVRDLLTGATSVADLLTDLIAGSPSTGQLLAYNGSAWAPANAGGRSLQTIDATQTLDSSNLETRILASHATVAITLTMPDPTTCSGSAVLVTRAGAAAVNLAANGSETFSGAASPYVMSLWESKVFVSDGTNWIGFEG